MKDSVFETFYVGDFNTGGSNHIFNSSGETICGTTGNSHCGIGYEFSESGMWNCKKCLAKVNKLGILDKDGNIYRRFRG